jgi:hypothetical protein
MAEFDTDDENDSDYSESEVLDEEEEKVSYQPTPNSENLVLIKEEEKVSYQPTPNSENLVLIEDEADFLRQLFEMSINLD